MIRSLIAVSFLTYAAVDPTLPEDPVIALQLGDVLCVAFEPSSKTCLVKITVSQETDEGTVLVEEMQLTDFGNPLRLSTLSTAKRREGQYCLVPKTIRSVVQPQLHPSALLLTIATVEGLNRYADAGYCVEHRRCEQEYIALAYSGGKRFAEEDMQYTLFRADDPTVKTLTPRPTSFKALEPTKGFVPIDCAP